MRHRNDICGWHGCAGRVEQVVDLDLTVTHTGPHDGAGRVVDAPGGPEVAKHAPEGSTTKCNFVARRCVKPLRGLERPVDCGDTRRRFRRRGFERALLAPREWIRSAGRLG